MLSIKLSSAVSFDSEAQTEQAGQTVTNPSVSVISSTERWVVHVACLEGLRSLSELNCTGKTDIVIMVVDGQAYQIDVKLARGTKTRVRGAATPTRSKTP